jgi:uncharacterized protein (TIGR03435 family)
VKALCQHAIVAAALLFCCGVSARSQTLADTPTFEVATVKPSSNGSPPMSIQRVAGGRLVTSNTPLTMLINWAFNLDDGRLIGAPKGADARFDVVAKAPMESPPPGQMQLMMRALLADRFKLVVHRESRDLTSYALVIDDGGPRVQVSTSADPPGPDPFRTSTSGMLTGTRVTADMLAKVLSSQLSRPVENTTGLAGTFDFTLQWRPDQRAVIDDDRASLFVAIREQLGFRLVARRAPVDVIVVDKLNITPSAD